MNDYYEPEFPERWRHGGWYTDVQYPGGGSGCVTNNTVDKKWMLACPVTGAKDVSFSTRGDAAKAEYLVAKTEERLIPGKIDDRPAINVIVTVTLDPEAAKYHQDSDRLAQLLAERVGDNVDAILGVNEALIAADAQRYHVQACGCWSTTSRSTPGRTTSPPTRRTAHKQHYVK